MYEYTAKLERIVDGDTVDVDIDLGFDIHIKKRVRLYGINAPESRTSDDEEKRHGLAAKQRLQELLETAENGEFILRTQLDKEGKYGRCLGTIIIGGMNVNKTLVQEGHASEYFGGKR
jgi:micrococcal nuclease